MLALTLTNAHNAVSQSRHGNSTNLITFIFVGKKIHHTDSSFDGRNAPTEFINIIYIAIVFYLNNEVTLLFIVTFMRRRQ